MSLIEIAAIALLVTVAFFLGRLSVIWHLAGLLVENNPDLAERLAKIEQEPDLLELVRDHDQWFAWAGTGEFLAQNDNLDSLFSRIRREHPGRLWQINRNGFSDREFDEIHQSLTRVYARGDGNDAN